MQKKLETQDISDIISMILPYLIVVATVIYAYGNVQTPSESGKMAAMTVQDMVAVGGLIVAILAIPASIIKMMISDKKSYNSIKSEISEITKSLDNQYDKLTEKSIPATLSIKEDTSAVRGKIDDTITPSVINIEKMVEKQYEATRNAKNSGVDLSGAMAQINAFAEIHMQSIVESQRREEELRKKIEELESTTKELLRVNSEYRKIIERYKKREKELNRDDDEFVR